MDSPDAPDGKPPHDPEVATWVRDILASGIEQPAGADEGQRPTGLAPSAIEPAAAPLTVPPIESGTSRAGELFDSDPARLAAQPPEPAILAYDDRVDRHVVTEADGSQKAHGLRNALEWVAVLGGAFIVALVIKTFLLQAFFIPSASMNSTLLQHDRILVNKLSYHLHDINHGDIIVFKRPSTEPSSDVRDLVKRVIGVAGDTVEARNGDLFLNGQLVIEPYLDEGIITNDFGPITIPSDHLFLMGDNRGDSHDSRSFGPVDEELVVGRAFVRVWPFNRLGLL
ncbi:MAG: signal peptidase I [Actinomycetia bacterium]|nr:signal peptidase I [Actinomycetes bacterium]